MPWHSKEAPLSFDQQSITGLQYLHGDLMARRYRQEWMRGKKYPIISFASGVQRELMAARPAQGELVVHIFGGMSLPREATCDEAYARAAQIAEENPDYRINRLSADILVVASRSGRRGYGLRYDNQARELVSVQLGWNADEMMDLLPGEIRAALPKLYSNETKGEDAIAVVKFFTPDANWTWWPTEFDGDDTFFGLVSGLEVELGYFSLSELESVRGALGLPVERDLYYEPKTLRDIRHTLP